MVDYAKKTVAELTEILKSRNLSHTGKKAELVARLNDADKEAEETGESSASRPKTHAQYALPLPLSLFPHFPPLVPMHGNSMLRQTPRP